MLPDLSLEGRTAIVTGASRGIGREIALVLAEAAADIVAAAKTISEIEATAADVEAMGREAIAVPTDVTDSSDVDALINRTLERFGKIDVLVNNAGLLLRRPVAPFPDTTLKPPRITSGQGSHTSDEDWKGIIDTNMNGVFYCCRAVAPAMMEQGYGKIININSNNATQAFPLVAAYNASKAAVNMLTRGAGPRVGAIQHMRQRHWLRRLPHSHD